MGLIHSRASKKRNKAEARLLDEQRRELAATNREARTTAAEELPWWRQRTLGAAIRKAREDREP